MTLLAVYFQLASSNYSYTVELYNFQLNAVNKTIHTLDKFSCIATFYNLECLSQYLVHFSTYRVTFQTRPCIFSTKLMNFCLHYSQVIIDQDQASNMCSIPFKWSVMKFLIVWFDQNLWLPVHKDSGHKKQSKDS